MASYTELYIDQGANLDLIIVLQDDETGESQNVDGYIFTSSLRKSILSPNATANLVCSIVNAANGEVGVFMDAGNTANLKAGRYFFDMKSHAGNTTTRLLEGTIVVAPSIT